MPIQITLVSSKLQQSGIYLLGVLCKLICTTSTPIPQDILNSTAAKANAYGAALDTPSIDLNYVQHQMRLLETIVNNRASEYYYNIRKSQSFFSLWPLILNHGERKTKPIGTNLAAKKIRSQL